MTTHELPGNLSDNEYHRMIDATDLSKLRELLEIEPKIVNRKVRRFPMDNRKTTGLHLASMRGRLATVQLLLEFGADPNCLDDFNQTPLYAACSKFQVDTAGELITAGADVDLGQVDMGETPLYAVCSRPMGTSVKQQNQIVNLLISAQADVNLPSCKTGQSPLYQAVRFNQLEIAGLLIRAMADVDCCELKSGDSLFHFLTHTTYSTYGPIMESLVLAGSIPNIPDGHKKTPIYSALVRKNDEVLSALIHAGANADWCRASEGPRPLHLAAQNNRERSNSIRLLIEKANADVNAKTDLGATPLLLAAETGHLEALDALINAMADVDAPTRSGSSPIFMAAQNGFNLTVKRLISAQANINAADELSVTPLAIAVQNGHEKVVDALLAAKADPDIRNFSGSLPIQYACQSGGLRIVEALLKAQSELSAISESPIYLAAQGGFTKIVDSLVAAQCDVDCLDAKGNSPAFMASQNGHWKVVDSLIIAQADVNLANREGISPLYTACEHGCHLVVESLLTKGQANPDCIQMDGYSPLHFAAQNGHVRIVDHLITALAHFDSRDDEYQTPMLVAANKGHSRVVTLLLNAGADCNLCSKIGASPLYFACQNGHAKMAKKLIKKGRANLNIQISNGGTALHAALRNSHIDIAEELIKAGADVNLQQFDGLAPLHIACQRNQEQMVEALIKAQALVDLRISQGATSLHFASRLGNSSIVRRLLHEGADVNALDSTGDSPLHCAAQFDCKQVALLLIDFLADVNQQNKRGITPIHFAANEGHSVFIDLLLKAMADVNANTSDGVSPLHVAALNGHTKTVKQLLKYGGQVDHCSKNGNTAIYSASTEGHIEIVAHLVEAQADINHRSLDGRTPLFSASRNGHVSVLKQIIAASADVDLQSDIGLSPVFAAIQNAHQSAVEELLFRGLASASVTSLDGFKPLQASLRSGESHIRIALALIRSSDIDIDAKGDNGESALHVSAREGFNQIVDKLVETGSDINLQTTAGFTPLYLAAQHDRDVIVSRLVRSMADTDLQALDGSSPLYIAARFGHRKVQQILVKANSTLIYRDDNQRIVSDSTISQVRTPIDLNYLNELASESSLESFKPLKSDEELSVELHLALTQAGCHKDRSALQSSVADVLQQIIRQRRSQPQADDANIVGSFSEGWGNSLTRVDGRIDPLADIDFMELIPGRLYHPKGLCKCANVADVESICDYSNGHISCAGFASNPAASDPTTCVRPAFDFVTACRLCCYPTIAPLQPDRIAKSQISKQVLESLQRELQTSQCHVVHASAPGMSGIQLRVSTTFLERRLLRSLNTIQGQLFVTLKYIVKKVISKEVQGVKAYHVKTITFRMLEMTPANYWTPENLINLIKRSLKMLLHDIRKSMNSAHSDGKVMWHYFLENAALYLKGSDRSSPQKIVVSLKSTLKNLPNILQRFMSTLKPLDGTGRFYFHPFVLLPDCRENRLSESRQSALQYHEIYDCVKHSLRLLAQPDACQASLLRLIDRLPDCARLTRETLRVLNCLKIDQLDGAIELLRRWKSETQVRPVTSKGMICSAPFDASSVWRQLVQGDFAWRFYFNFDDESVPVLSFLPDRLSAWFPLKCESTFDCYLNFRALLESVQLELLTPIEEDEKPVVKETLLNDDSSLFDTQELLVTLRYNGNLNFDDMRRLKSEHLEEIEGNQFVHTEWELRNRQICGKKLNKDDVDQQPTIITVVHNLKDFGLSLPD